MSIKEWFKEMKTGEVSPLALWVVENVVYPIENRTKHLVTARTLAEAHAKGREIFGKVSFTTRTPTEDDKLTIQVHIP